MVSVSVGSDWSASQKTTETSSFITSKEEIQTPLPDIVFLWAANQDHLSAERWITARDPSPTRGAATKDIELAIHTANLFEDLENREWVLTDAYLMFSHRQ